MAQSSQTHSRPSDVPVIYHLTANTGDVCLEDTSIYSQTLALLAPIVAAKSGIIPKTAGFRFCVPEMSERTAVFRISTRRATVIQCMACWNQTTSAARWHDMRTIVMEEFASDLRLDDGNVPVFPPEGPWLVTVIYKEFALLPRDTQMMLGDLEHCLMRVIMQTEGV